MTIRDCVPPERLEECSGCGGAGERCQTRDESVDNCECSEDGSTWYECSECAGEGVIESDLEEFEEE